MSYKSYTFISEFHCQEDLRYFPRFASAPPVSYLTWIGPGLFTQACYSFPPTCILPLVAIINAQ